jgi:drug/metabolite transporter (DMT)-like permease
MIAILGGLGAACSWAIATLSSSRSSRMIGPMSVIAWVMIVGVAVSIPFSIADMRSPHPLQAAQIVGLIVNGVSSATGLVLAYSALVIGRVSIVTPIVSTEGAVAAIASVVLGEPLGIPTAVILGAIACGVVLASIDRRADEVLALAADAPVARPARHQLEHPDLTRRSVLLSIAAAVAFSVGLIVSARLGSDMPLSWIVLTSRLPGLLLIAVPLLARGRLRLSRRALPLVLVSGVLEVVGLGAYVTGAQVSPATAAVLGSQFAAIAAVSAFVLFHERLARVQVAGITLIGIGVTALAIVRV